MQIRANGLLNDFYRPNFPLYANVISPIGVYFAQTKKGERGKKGGNGNEGNPVFGE